MAARHGVWDRGKPGSFYVYVGALTALAVALVSSIGIDGLQADWFALVLFLALSVMAEVLSVGLPKGKGRVSVSFAINFAAIMIFGPVPGALVAGVAVVLANLIANYYLDIVLFNAVTLALTAGAAGFVWEWAGGNSGSAPVLGEIWLPALLGGVTYMAANTVLVTAAISLWNRSAWKDVWATKFRWAIPNYLALGGLGLLIVSIYHSSMGLFGSLLVWIPLMIARYAFQQYIAIRRAHLETVQVLAAALEAKDTYTRGHSDRVAELASHIGRALKLNEEDLEAVYLGGLMHDIGKIGVSESVLHKVGRLTEAEFNSIRQHPVVGWDMVKPVGFLRAVALTIRHHHEWYNGRGYPDGLRGEAIPLGARITALADAYDAMTSGRAYREGLAPEAALQELIAGRGTQFDPRVVDAFVQQVWPGLPEADGATGVNGSARVPAVATPAGLDGFGGVPAVGMRAKANGWQAAPGQPAGASSGKPSAPAAATTSSPAATAGPPPAAASPPAADRPPVRYVGSQ